MGSRPRKLISGIFLLLGSAFIPRSASAQDFFMNTASARSNALGGTYVASSSDVVDALASNPAGLSYLRGRNVNVNLDTIFARGSFSNTVNTNSPMQTSPGVVPYGAFGMPIDHSRWSFGVGVTPDLLSVSDWQYVDAPGAFGATYGLQEQKAEIVAIRSAAGVAYAFSKRFSVGATFGVEYNTNQLKAPYIFQSQPSVAGLKTLLDLHTHGTGWNTSVGFSAKPNDHWQFGAAWRSRTVIDSTGDATGDIYAQFAALGVNAPSDFAYSAKVRSVLPQSVLASAAWQANRRWLFAVQGNWINWQDSFVNLPVALSGGTNATINSVVGSDALQDGVPLHWKDQYAIHAGVEHSLTENTVLRFGFAHANDPVPSSTLTPLTAAIMTNQVTGGFGYNHGRSRWELAYSFHPEHSQSVDQSSLLLGEYNASTVHVGTQSLTVAYSFKF
ncbi:MAG TPA: outer membrane protein transport protein [Dongiaceae bacterium]|nr:outer membrane protein transport protein [Dongiaceae bacterium]